MCDESVFFLNIAENHFKRWPEKPFVAEGIVQDKTASISIHGMRKKETATNVSNAERAAMFGTFLLRNKNQQLC